MFLNPQIRHLVPDAARGYYKEVLNGLILSDKILSTNEKYQSNQYNEEIFTEIWGENPKLIKILHGPRCLNRPLRIEA